MPKSIDVIFSWIQEFDHLSLYTILNNQVIWQCNLIIN